MTELEVPDARRRWIYWVALGLLVALGVAAVLSFTAARSTGGDAEAKAGELIAALDAAGAPTPSTEQVVNLLGDDGGAACTDPAHALSRATLFTMLTNGAAGPGQRPVVADSKVVQGQELIIETYCPDELDDFQELVADLDLQEAS